MTAPSTKHSAYPKPIDDLMPAARRLTAKLGTLPSRNQLKTTLKIGAPKASAVLAGLVAEANETATTEAVSTADAAEQSAISEAVPARLHLVQSTPEGRIPDDASDVAQQPVIEPVLVASNEVGPVIVRPVPLANDLSSETVPVAVDAAPEPVKRPRSWPVLLLALPAMVAIWSGWVALGKLAGFGEVAPLPGIVDDFTINTAITLPIGVETYSAYALHVWLSGHMPARARKFAKWSAIAALLVGALGQIAYHLLEAGGHTVAPWPITMAVACLPVAVLGMGAALAHLVRDSHHNTDRSVSS